MGKGESERERIPQCRFARKDIRVMAQWKMKKITKVKVWLEGSENFFLFDRPTLRKFDFLFQDSPKFFRKEGEFRSTDCILRALPGRTKNRRVELSSLKQTINHQIPVLDQEDLPSYPAATPYGFH